MNRWPFLRDFALFIGGLAGVAHETLGADAERPTLLILFAAMMGLPAFLQKPGVAAPPPATFRPEAQPPPADQGGGE